MLNRRASFYRAGNNGIMLTDMVMQAAKQYIDSYPDKTLMHASQEKAKDIIGFALAYKNLFRAAAPAEEMLYLVEFLQGLDARLEQIRKERKSTLFKLFIENRELERMIRTVVATCIGNYAALTTHELIQKMLEEFGNDLLQSRTSNAPGMK